MAQFFEDWVRRYSGDLGETLSVSLTRGVQTFPLPSLASDAELADLGRKVQQSHVNACDARDVGLTDLYNAVHDSRSSDADIQELRELRIQVDQKVAAAYGWVGLDLGHGFHETKHGLRFTIAESARRTALERLLALNHDRHAKELKAGSRAKGPRKGRRAKSIADPPASTLFG
jgi:hypothetical protein